MVSASPRTHATSDHRTEWRVTTEEAPVDAGGSRGRAKTPPSPTLEKQQRLHMLPSDEVEPVVGQEPASEDSGENGVTDGSGHFKQQGAVVPAIDGANHPAASRPTAPTHSRVPSQVVHPSSVGDDKTAFEYGPSRIKCCRSGNQVGRRISSPPRFGHLSNTRSPQAPRFVTTTDRSSE